MKIRQIASPIYSEAYPGLHINDGSIAHEVTELTLTMEELDDARDARR